MAGLWKRGRESFQHETRAGVSCTPTRMDKRLSQSPGTKPALTCDSTPSAPHCRSGKREKKTPENIVTAGGLGSPFTFKVLLAGP